VEVATLADFLQKDMGKGASKRIENRIVILPPAAGGLNNGMLDGQADYREGVDYDVADKWFDETGTSRRLRIWDNESIPDNMRVIRQIDCRPYLDDDEEEQEHRDSRRLWCWYELSKVIDTQELKAAAKPVLLDIHSKDMASVMEKIVAALKLSKELQTALVVAARFHDMGKQCELWQRSIGNFNPAPPWLAKSGRGMRPLDITKYRHELGSLVQIVSEEEFQKLDEDMKDLVMHIIAAHHGRARPHFPDDESFVPKLNGQSMNEILYTISRRFAQLHRKYGRWGLAYLESILRAADYETSANPTEFALLTKESEK